MTYTRAFLTHIFLDIAGVCTVCPQNCHLNFTSTNCARVTYLEALDRFLSGIWKFFVCPSQNIFFGNWSSIRLQFSEEGQCVSSHQLPDKSQDQHFFALPNARTSLDMDRTPYFDIFYVGRNVKITFLWSSWGNNVINVTPLILFLNFYLNTWPY